MNSDNHSAEAGRRWLHELLTELRKDAAEAKARLQQVGAPHPGRPNYC